MFIETRKAGKHTKYYLVHSFREGKAVRKIRRYLGADLSEKQIQKKRPIAEAQILNRLKACRRITDPFRTALSDGELKAMRRLEARQSFKVFHLSEDDWKEFTQIFTYNTNAIEGSEITQEEVNEITRDNKWPPDRTKEDISETYGVTEAVRYIRTTRDHLSLPLIKELHRIVFRNSKPSFAGSFRNPGVNVVIQDSRGNVVHRGAPPEQVPRLLKELVAWYEKHKETYPPLVLAAVVHNQFENIHPFQDGNGRVGRLLLNNILIKHGLPPVNIDLDRRAEYYASLREYENNSNLRPTLELLLREYKILKRRLSKKEKRR
jgi:Fic family protein